MMIQILFVSLMSFGGVDLPLPEVVVIPTAKRLREFPTTTLREHRRTLTPLDLATSQKVVNGDDRAISWSFKLQYEGQTQPIARERRDLVNFVVSKNPQLKNQYEFEILVSDGEETFWLPIQNGTLVFFKKDQLKKGDKLFAQTRYFGSYFQEVPRQFFLMLGYRKSMNPYL